jgi:hypothetical protein
MNIINPLEAEILKEAFGFDDVEIKHTKLVDREMTGVGFYTRVAIPECRAEEINEWNGRLPELQGDHALLKNGAGFIFWKETNRELTIEGYTYDELWPNALEAWTLKPNKTD